MMTDTASENVYPLDFRQKRRRKGTTLTEDSITGSKRWLRVVYWKHTISALRVRFPKTTLQVLILAGPLPQEEIGLLRSLDDNLYIVVVDRDKELVTRAKEAGADEAIWCHVGGMVGRRFRLSPQLMGRKFHAIWLDTSTLATLQLRKMVHVCYDNGLRLRGMLLVTFQVSKDFDYKDKATGEWHTQKRLRNSAVHYVNRWLVSTGYIDEGMAARIWYVFTALSRILTCCVQYNGGEGEKVPMMACLLTKPPTMPKRVVTPIKFFRLEKDDYMRAAVTGNLVGPVEQLEQVRHRYDQLIKEDIVKGINRSAGAFKANITRRNKRIEELEAELLAETGARIGDLDAIEFLQLCVKELNRQLADTKELINE
jgi:hypothetical protein